MITFVLKNLNSFISKHASPVCRSSPVSFSLSLRSFSNSAETQQGISPTILDVLLHKHNFPPELASRVASELRHLKTPEKADSMLSFFTESGFSNTQLVKIVKCSPRFLSASLEGRIKPKIKILQDLGISSGEICKIISSDPLILGLSVKNNIIPSVSVLKGFLGSNNEVSKVIRRAPRFLKANFQNTVIPNVEFFKSCGIPMERICIILTTYPNCFTVKPKVLRKHAAKARAMGISGSSKTFIYAIPTIASMSNETWEMKFQAFRDLGFSDSDILTMFRKDPPVLLRSIEKIKKVIELLLGTGKFTIASIVDCPRSLYCSIQKRYIPRLQILGMLESKYLIKEWPALATICIITDDKFNNRFIRPYLDEVTDIYVSKSSARGKE